MTLFGVINETQEDRTSIKCISGTKNRLIQSDEVRSIAKHINQTKSQGLLLIKVSHMMPRTLEWLPHMTVIP